jgi:hypothetical protein
VNTVRAQVIGAQRVDGDEHDAARTRVAMAGDDEQNERRQPDGQRRSTEPHGAPILPCPPPGATRGGATVLRDAGALPLERRMAPGVRQRFASDVLVARRSAR